MANTSPLDSAPVEDDDFTFEIDATQEVTVPKGTYPAMVDNVKSGFSNAGNAMLIWEFMLLGKEHLGKKLTMFTVTTPAAMWKLNSVLNALGFKKGEDGKVRFKPADAKNRRCVVEVVEETYEGQPRSSIKNVLRHPEGYAWPEGQLPPSVKGNSPF